MSKGPENRLIQSVHRLLPDTVYYEKMHNPYRGGTPDVWYSGKKRDMWVEYKYLPTVPKTGTVVPALSELQKLWLRNRWKEGRAVHVAVGCSNGICVFSRPVAWEQGAPAQTFNGLLVTKGEFADWIVFQTTGDPLNAENRRKTRSRS